MLCFSKYTYWTELNSYVCLVQLYRLLLGTFTKLTVTIWLYMICTSCNNSNSLVNEMKVFIYYIVLTMRELLFILYVVLKSQTNLMYWVTQKFPQICTDILRICIGKVTWFAVYICGNFWVTQYMATKYL